MRQYNTHKRFMSYLKRNQTFENIVSNDKMYQVYLLVGCVQYGQVCVIIVLYTYVKSSKLNRTEILRKYITYNTYNILSSRVMAREKWFQ